MVSKGKQKAVEQPSVTEEAPPLPDEEQPPLPDGEEEPPLPSEDEQDDGGDEQDDAPPLPDEDEPEPATGATEGPPVIIPAATHGDWTAVWDKQAQAYYFWNKKTQETTWVNPVQVPAEASTSTATVQSTVPAGGKLTKLSYSAEGNVDGIDPDLVYLDPKLAIPGRESTGPGPAFSARFNARTGRFEGDPEKTPDRVSGIERAKRQNQNFFDYDGWQKAFDMKQDIERQKRAAGESSDAPPPKKLTKAQLEKFRERKKQRKEERQKGWLLDND
ncbi:uncharacterized protein L969DRAFT_25759 [Mixia osmundae IAM 14324]|uniref:WW domain-containing protein n=1 Tax=Mixia osmundae (strain CBS 9802 / IAM 14324 / JCM 22182 / KY 12970) TaxID=764103 RepID=G7DWF7_MIXOS|nr:uncharacterized protein L969DRAFT_25759 [Mixia osmundae IAM 14324]KEI37319.1 hypothetical protein L969DRAFT_25759 [Mixia osmundae IAM 14324]GAA94917.1 hypothetical protein E5Q_01572 [Mixia osmundae IAM 14324]